MSLLDALVRKLAMTPARLQPRVRRSIAAASQQLEMRLLLSGAPLQFTDPHPEVGNQFGATVTVLSNGNVVITSPNDDAGGGSTATGTGAGSVYLYNGQTLGLISTLSGSHSGDQIGLSGVIALTNGNFLVTSSSWNGNRGAVTWGSGSTGVKGTVSATNSLVGSATGDYVGMSGITKLTNGNYVVDSPIWNNRVGAVTWGSGTTGVTGSISATNSLVGTTAGDSVGGSQNFYFGGGVKALTNGNYVIASPDWSNGKGAATWGDGTKGVRGVVAITNSLIGSNTNDAVGVSGVTVLANGNYVVGSRNAVTWGNGTTGFKGQISATNSLIASSNNVIALSNGNYVVNNPYWNGSYGAVTWGNGTTGVSGVVSSTNSIVGSNAGDDVGSAGVTTLRNGNYVVDSPQWNGNCGAVTFGNGANGVTGSISSKNSLIGGVAGDYVGKSNSFYGGVVELTNGNYVVSSPNWGDGTFDNLGAVTWGNGTTGVTGLVSPFNSLVGSTGGDYVGAGRRGNSITPLANGNYVVDSPDWSNGSLSEAGAVTWGNGTRGITGAISAANSLVGSSESDQVGLNGVTALTNGNYVVDSLNWQITQSFFRVNVGAVTWGNGTTGTDGIVSASNSLIGSTDGESVVGSGGVTALSNGNYVVNSPEWGIVSTVFNAGAVTWGDGTKGLVGVVNSTNSLVGSVDFDQVGSNGIKALTDGNYVVSSSNWSNGGISAAGAVTWGDGTKGATGKINASNSLIGTSYDDEVGRDQATALRDGNYIVSTSRWNNRQGAVTWGSGATGVTGVVSNNNSVLGPSIRNSNNFNTEITTTYNDVYDTFYASFSGNGSGRVYLGATATGFPNITTNGPSINVSTYIGGVTAGNSTVDIGKTTIGTPVTQTIRVTNEGNAPLTVQPVKVTSGFTVLNNFRAGESIAAGASANFTLQLDATTTGTLNGVVTIFDNDSTANPFTFNVTGTVNASNAQFVDPHQRTGDQFGGSVTVLTNGNVVITSPNDDAGGGSTAAGTGAGAVYLFNGQTGALISTLTGSNAGDQIGTKLTYGGGGVFALPNGNFVIDSPVWNSARGAVTFGNGQTGVSGPVSAVNSLVGSVAGDGVGYFQSGGSGGVTILTNGNYVVSSQSWSNWTGAVTWGSGKTGVIGTISASNSLIGSNPDDFIEDKVTPLSDGNYVVDCSNWNSGLGAVTWGSGTTGVAGTISASNSLVGTFQGDRVGSEGVTALSNGNYVVDSSVWNDYRGAVTLGYGTTGVIGAISSANSLVGDSAYDEVGNEGVTALINGNYVVDSTWWNGYRGAVTFGSGTSGVTGFVSAANSLVGSTGNISGTGDLVGSNGVTALTNGNYVVDSASWNGSCGAVTFGSGTGGIVGVVSETNSLVGMVPGNKVGQSSSGARTGGVTALPNGNYVVVSPYWSNGNVSHVGAVTFGNGTVGITGFVSAANSLVGSLGNGTGTGDLVGSNGVTVLTNDNYVVDSPSWNGNRGAVTFGNGTGGISGVVSATNSLIGTTSGDSVGQTPSGGGTGGVTALSNGNYVVASPDWSNGNIAGVGSVTWVNGTTCISGTVSVANSLVGASRGESVGIDGVTALTNGNYVVSSPYASISGGSGAVTWANGKTGLTGTITTSNSLVGSSYFDFVGGGGITALSNGNYVVETSRWSGNLADSVGAVTWGNGATGVSGTISAANSLIGTSFRDKVGSGGVKGLSTGNYVVISPSWNGGLGAVTFANGGTGLTGTLSSANSVVGQSPPNGNVNLTISITTDDAHGRLYAIFPKDGPGFVYRGSTATGFTVNTNSGPSIGVASNSVGIVNGTGTPNFGTANIGVPVTQTITVTNTGASPLVVQPVSVTGGFSVLNNFTSNESIASGASANFTIQLNATASGTQNGLVSFGTNLSSLSRFTFNVIGTVTAPKMTVQQGSTTLSNHAGTVNFGSTPLGSRLTQVFTVMNHGNAPLFVTSITAPAGTSVINDAVTKRFITAGTSASFSLQLNSTVAGPLRGVVTINNSDSTDGPFTFNFTGMVLKISNVVTPTTFILAEKSANGTKVGTVLASDVDKQPLTYAIIGGNINGAFSINSTTGQITVANSSALLLTTNPSFALTVQATDSVSSGSATITINLARISLSNTSIVETASRGTIVGQFATTEPGSGNIYHYSLVPGKYYDFKFKIDANGNLTVKTGLNAAIQNSYTIDVTSTDQNHRSITQTFQILILGPSDILLSNNRVAQRSGIGTVVGKFATTDAGTGNAFSFRLPSNKFDNADFTIDASGNLILNVNPSKTARKLLLVDVVTTDQRGLSLTKVFAVFLK